jgi:hypothetical protein
MTDISGNVEAMSGYTIGSATTDTITEAEYTIFLAWAQAKVTADGITGTDTDHATSLLVCHYIARKGGETGKTSETIGKYSYVMSSKFSNSVFQSVWMDEYNALKRQGVYVVKVN